MSHICRMTENLGQYAQDVDAAVNKLCNGTVIERIWQHDHTVWKPSPAEITNRLGWLTIPGAMLHHAQEINAFARDICSRGYTHALLMGMGGSSLAPEVLRNTFGTRDGYPDLTVLDSTDPAVVAATSSKLDPDKTLYIVSTKSGTTTETLSFFRYFYTIAADVLGRDRAGSHFIAITDPATPLADMAEHHHFIRTFINEPTIGGRYSALSYFGLVPAALMGIDIETLLQRALSMRQACTSPGGCAARLGAILGEMALRGRDKATFVISKGIERFGDWGEQLIAESTGKEGTGIVPVIGEHLGEPGQYRADRLFISMATNDDDSCDDRLKDLEREGHPVIRLHLHDRYDLGGQFFLWEMATAVAGHILGINPFDQPDVESAKVLSRQAVDEYRETGALPVETPVLCEMNTSVYAGFQPGSLKEAIRAFLDAIEDGSYVAVQAYLQPTGQIDAALDHLRMKIRDTFRVATTLGYGPRFLHSTGQLHKGDSGRGLFIQITGEDPLDVSIPDEAGTDASSMSFGVLKTAQAQGDLQALKHAGRKILRLHLGVHDMAGTIRRIAGLLD